MSTPSKIPRSARGGNTPSPESLSEAKKRIADGGKAELEAEMERVCTTDKKSTMARLTMMGIPHDGVTDLAVLRQMVAHELQIGVLPTSKWSKMQIPCAVNEVLQMNASPAGLGTGKKARSYLRAALEADGDDPARQRLDFGGGDGNDNADQRTADEFHGLDGYDPDVRLQIEALILQDKARKAEREGKNPADLPKLTRGSFEKTEGGKHWRTSATILDVQKEVFNETTTPLTLAGREHGWEVLLNYASAWEFMAETHHNPKHRGYHFFTVVVAILRSFPRIAIHDTTGHGEIAETDGNADMAYEWLGAMGTIGEERMGSGRTVAQLKLSKSTIKGLAGGSASGATPAHLVAHFAQLFRAGDDHQKGQPFTPGNRASPGSSSANDTEDNAQLAETEIQSTIKIYHEASPGGVARSTIERAVRAMAASEGHDFKGKQITYLRDFAGKITGGGMNLSDGVLPLDPLECPTCLCLHAISFPLRSCTCLHAHCSYSARASAVQHVPKHP